MEGSALLLITSQNLAGIYVGSTSQLGEFCYEDFWEQFMVSFTVDFLRLEYELLVC